MQPPAVQSLSQPFQSFLAQRKQRDISGQGMPSALPGFLPASVFTGRFCQGTACASMNMAKGSW